MDNTEYYNELENRIITIRELRKSCTILAADIIGKTLFKEDFFFCAAADRCAQLSDGLIVLLQHRNLSCVGALLRLQMDNCMRTYAAFIAADQPAVIDCVIKGRKISDQKDVSGRNMTDAYLKKKMAIFNTSFPDVYDRTSGYVHFSEMAFYQTVVSCNNETITCQVGQPLQERFNPLLLEAADAFVHFVKINHKMLQAVAESKARYDATQCDV